MASQNLTLEHVVRDGVGLQLYLLHQLVGLEELIVQVLALNPLRVRSSSWSIEIKGLP